MAHLAVRKPDSFHVVHRDSPLDGLLGLPDLGIPGLSGDKTTSKSTPEVTSVSTPTTNSATQVTDSSTERDTSTDTTAATATATPTPTPTPTNTPTPTDTPTSTDTATDTAPDTATVTPSQSSSSTDPLTSPAITLSPPASDTATDTTSSISSTPDDAATSTPPPTTPPSSSQSSSVTTSSTSTVGSAGDAGSAPKSFLANKPLSIGVITVGALVVLIIVIVVTTWAVRKRRKDRLHNDFIDFSNSNDHLVDDPEKGGRIEMFPDTDGGGREVSDSGHGGSATYGLPPALQAYTYTPFVPPPRNLNAYDVGQQPQNQNTFNDVQLQTQNAYSAVQQPYNPRGPLAASQPQPAFVSDALGERYPKIWANNVTPATYEPYEQPSTHEELAYGPTADASSVYGGIEPRYPRKQVPQITSSYVESAQPADVNGSHIGQSSPYQRLELPDRFGASTPMSMSSIMDHRELVVRNQ